MSISESADIDHNMDEAKENALLNENTPPGGDLLSMESSNLDFNIMEDKVIEEAEFNMSKKLRVKPSVLDRLKTESTKSFQIEGLTSGAPKKKAFNLADLLNNNDRISPAMQKPVDTDTMEGKRDLVAQKDREAKNDAKINCIDKFSSMDTHIQHLPVIKTNLSETHQIVQINGNSLQL